MILSGYVIFLLSHLFPLFSRSLLFLACECRCVASNSLIIASAISPNLPLFKKKSNRPILEAGIYNKITLIKGSNSIYFSIKIIYNNNTEKMEKRKFFKLILVILFISSPIFAQNDVNETIYIKSSRFAAPLIEKWIAEYTKVNPHVQIKLADNSVKAENVSLKVVVSNNSKNKLQIGEQTLFFGRYAILPVIGKENPLLAEFSKKKLNDKKIKELFFEQDILSDDTKPSKLNHDVTIYSGNNDESVAHSFASYFGYTSTSLKGKRISGDDAFLINAIQKDKTGITFNALSNIFDINTRELKDNISILPLDLKKEYRNYFSESVNIDNVIEILEAEPIDLIPIENIGFAYSPGNKLVKEFLTWILTEGKTFNHSYGILNPDEKLLTYQIKELEKVLYTMNLK